MPVELLCVSFTLIKKKLQLFLRFQILPDFFSSFFLKSRHMWQNLMSKRAELNVSDGSLWKALFVWLKSFWTRPLCCLGKGLLCIRQRNVCVALRAHYLLALRCGENKTFMEALRGSSALRGKRAVWVSRRRVGVGRRWLPERPAQSVPGCGPQCLQPPPGTACSLPARLWSFSKYFQFSAENHVSY